MYLTARGYHRVLRVARTLADLDGAETLGRLHLAEALSLPRQRHGPFGSRVKRRSLRRNRFSTHFAHCGGMKDRPEDETVKPRRAPGVEALARRA